MYKHKFYLGEKVTIYINKPTLVTCSTCEGLRTFSNGDIFIKCPRCNGTGQEASPHLMKTALQVMVTSITFKPKATQKYFDKYLNEDGVILQYTVSNESDYFVVSEDELREGTN